jgi:hypothetical protein
MGSFVVVLVGSCQKKILEFLNCYPVILQRTHVELLLSLDTPMQFSLETNQIFMLQTFIGFV